MKMNVVTTSAILLVVITAFIVKVQGQVPEIVNDILPEIQRVGKTGKLNCTVARLNKNGVQWSFVGKQPYIVSFDQEIKTINPRRGGILKYTVERHVNGDQVTFTLVIARLRPELSGPYECMVIVANGKTENNPRKTGQLIVQFPPVIRPGSTTTVKQVDEGQSTIIECDAHSVPPPNITWVRSDGRLLPNGKALSRGKQLTISFAEINFAGVYRCVADNSIKPPASALTQVYVRQKAVVRVLQDSVGQIPNGRLAARLDCIVQGYPVPIVYWEFYQPQQDRYVRLKNTDKYMTTKQATDNQNLFNGEQWYTLEIKNVQAGDIGMYYCVGENTKGKSRELVTLFATEDCQGPLCYTQDPEGRGATVGLCPLTLLIALCLATLGRRISVMA